MLCPCGRCQNQTKCDARTSMRLINWVGFKVINVWSSCGENYYDVGESSTAGQFMREETQYAEEESYQQNINVNMGGDIGSTHILENAMEAPNDEEC